MQMEDFMNRASVMFPGFDAMRGLNRLSLDMTEKLLIFQLDRARGYTDIALKQWREALDVRDAASLQNFLAARGEVAQQVTRQMQDDFKKLAEISSDYSRESQKIVREQSGKKAA